MNVLGVHLTLLVGATVPVPAPRHIAEALDSVEVRHSDDARSGFQISFRMRRGGPADLLDYPLIRDPLLRPFNRFILVVTVNGRSQVLIDGFATNQQHSVGTDAGAARLVLTGEDVTYTMDREEKSFAHPGLGDANVARKILAGYAQYGIRPQVIDAPSRPPKNPSEKVPTQQGTDLGHLQEMARRHAYVFFVRPGPAPGLNEAWWGPPSLLSQPQPALSVNLGSSTNVESIDFQYNALAPTTIEGRVQDSRTNRQLPVRSFASTRPPRSARPTLLADRPMVRSHQFRRTGVTIDEALAWAQAQTDASTDEVVTATGTLDTVRYGRLLEPRGLVGVRGAGWTYDGYYYVKSVSHSIGRGSYRQRFTIVREGLGSTTPVVVT